MRKLIILSLLTFYFSLFTSPVSASESSLTVSPAILEKVLEPGAVSTASATITNTTDFPLPIKAQVDAFIGNNNFTKLQSSIFDSSSWFTLVPSDFILQPKESKEILIKISEPENIEPGGHYATIFFEPLIPEGVISPSSTISLARVGILTFLIAPGDIKELLSIKDFEVIPWSTFGPISFDVGLKNEGNVHTSPSGKIVIKDLLGNTVTTLDLNNSMILPTTTDVQNIVWDKQLLFGRFTVNLTVEYGSPQGSLTFPPLVFWVVPWPLIVIVIALLTLLYKIFIVHIDRVKLAISVLKGKDVKPQTLQENNSLHSSSRRRTHPTHPHAKRSSRR